MPEHSDRTWTNWRRIACAIGIVIVGITLFPRSSAVRLSITGASSYAFGTIQTAPTTAASEAQSGVSVAMMTVAWSDVEPQEGVFDTTKLAQVKQELATYQAAGQKVVLSFALHYTPGWVFNYANSRYTDQYGVLSADNSANLTFNATLRVKAQAYLATLNQYLGFKNFAAVRIGTAVYGGELLYPSPWDSANNAGAYWAYDTNAQNGSGLPTSIPPNPLPGWKAGSSVYNGAAVSTAQVKQWLDWYIGALDDTANWQIQYLKSLGFAGQFQLLTPSGGTRPDLYSQEINSDLSITWDSSTGTGGVWYKVYQLLPDKTNVVAYVTSMAEGSGSPVNNVCASTDINYGVTDTDYNPSVENSWSSTRWIVRLANAYGMPANGENSALLPPYTSPAPPLQVMQTDALLMSACHMQGMMFWMDSVLYDSTSGVTMQDYASVIAKYNPTPTPTPTPVATATVTPTATPTPSPTPTITPTPTPTPSPTPTPTPTPAPTATPIPTPTPSPIPSCASQTITVSQTVAAGSSTTSSMIAGSGCTNLQSTLTSRAQGPLKLAIYRGNTLIGQSSSGISPEQVMVPVTSGTTYQVVVTSLGKKTTFTLRLTTSP